MRTFIAIELNKEIKEALSGIQKKIKTMPEDVKWVAPHNIHLTLKFLGEVDEAKIPKIIQSIKEAAIQFKPFRVALADIGVFPNLKFPRIIWIGIEEGKEKLEELAKFLENLLARLKFPKEKRSFSPHLTLGRIKSLRSKDAFCAKINEVRVEKLRQEIQSIILFKSTLAPGGPIYEKIAEVNLKNI